jgi:hypothetical protein
MRALPPMLILLSSPHNIGSSNRYFMYAMVSDVVTVLKEKSALCDEGYCVQDVSFGEGEYTGQGDTSVYRVVCHGYKTGQDYVYGRD